jgi:hypothetical protein
MIKVKAFIERGSDGTYGIYVDLDENRLNYGVIGDGKTVNEAVQDFYGCYEDMKLSFRKDNQHFQEVEFEFHYDTASFLQYYTSYFSLAGISRLTGINQRQLSQYVNGTRNPSKQTIEKIDNSIHSFAKNLSQVQFV